MTAKSVILISFNYFSDKLKRYYTDDDSLRQEEINSISGPNEFAEFYGRLRTIKQYHRKYPNEVAEPMQMEFLRFLSFSPFKYKFDTQNLRYNFLSI